MREGNPVTTVSSQTQTTSPSITPNPTISHVVDNNSETVSTFNAVEGANSTSQLSTYMPWQLPSSWSNSENPYVAAQRSGIYNGKDNVYASSGDTYNFTNTQTRFSKPGGTERFTKELNEITVKNMVATATNFRNDYDFANNTNLPDAKFTPTPHGLLVYMYDQNGQYVTTVTKAQFDQMYGQNQDANAYA